MMWIGVGERTSEIGLLKALGANRSDVRNLFLAEAALLSGVGGVVGSRRGDDAGRARPARSPGRPVRDASGLRRGRARHGGRRGPRRRGRPGPARRRDGSRRESPGGVRHERIGTSDVAGGGLRSPEEGRRAAGRLGARRGARARHLARARGPGDAGDPAHDRGGRRRAGLRRVAGRRPRRPPHAVERCGELRQHALARLGRALPVPRPRDDARGVGGAERVAGADGAGDAGGPRDDGGSRPPRRRARRRPARP